ncbi:hypothetical protein DFH08DRAFT_899413 [Mycena albidolilacea]|uniref:DUF6534 domain-containing protein n=1 Tax=Mycena albidolilacea TaxID=1033008 RepID=A0AAD7EB64_9AGAR|nr:hypothetical protein DFH08DRAFT_899413 [Mycena albidolilacea]
MSLPALDTVTGRCLLVATWASSLLYMFEVYQGLYYFRHFMKDDWKFKTLVTVALLVDAVSIVGDYSGVYLYTITHAGDLEYLNNTHWPLPLYSFTTGVLGALVQGFLLIRYWRFTRNSLISLVLSLGIIITLGGVFAISCMVALYPSFKDRLKLEVPAAIWLVTEVVVDAGIASALLWEFRKASGILIQTKGILDRLTAVTIQSGASAATLALAALISYYTIPESNHRFGTLLTITQLANLNIRKSGRSLSTTVVHSGPGRASGGEQRPLTLTSWNIDDSYGIHVHHTVHPSVSLEDTRLPHSAGTSKHVRSSCICTQC